MNGFIFKQAVLEFLKHFPKNLKKTIFFITLYKFDLFYGINDIPKKFKLPDNP